MEVTHLILALGADLSGRLHLLNSGFDSLSGPFPGIMPVPLYVAGKLLFWKEETGKRYGTAVDLVAPDGRVVVSIDKDIDVAATADPQRPVSHSGLVTFMGVNFETLGHYKVRQLVDGEVVKVIPLFIERATEPATENPHGGN
jgi:hypothetical protein